MKTNRSFVFLSSIGVKGGCSMAGSITSFEDKTLIEMAVAGQTECFSVLISRYRPTVKTCIRAVLDNGLDVEDAVQNTFLRAWLRLSTFRFEASFRTWITRVAVNEALATHRRRRCRPQCSAVANFDIYRSSCESPYEALARSEAHRSIRNAIAALPKKYREILTLCELEQLSADEAARRLKSSISLVKTRLFRARRMLSLALNTDTA